MRPDVPPGLARVIERAIDPLPERRTQSARPLAADLASLKPRPERVRLAYAAAGAAGDALCWPGSAGRFVDGRSVSVKASGAALGADHASSPARSARSSPSCR